MLLKLNITYKERLKGDAMREFLLSYSVSGDGIVGEVKCKAIDILEAAKFAKLSLKHMLNWNTNINVIEIESLDNDGYVNEYVRLQKDLLGGWKLTVL